MKRRKIVALLGGVTFGGLYGYNLQTKSAMAINLDISETTIPENKIDADLKFNFNSFEITTVNVDIEKYITLKLKGKLETDEKYTTLYKNDEIKLNKPDNTSKDITEQLDSIDLSSLNISEKLNEEGDIANILFEVSINHKNIGKITDFQDNKIIVTESELNNNVILKPDENDLDNFSIHTTDYAITTDEPVFTGDYSVKYPSGTTSSRTILSQSGLDHYPTVGKKHSFFIWIPDDNDRSGGANPYVVFGASSDLDWTNGEGYAIHFKGITDGKSIHIVRWDDGDREEIESSQEDILLIEKWMAVEIIHKSNGDIIMNLYDASDVGPNDYSDGNKIVTLQTNDSKYISDGDYKHKGVALSNSRQVEDVVDLWRTE